MIQSAFFRNIAAVGVFKRILTLCFIYVFSQNIYAQDDPAHSDYEEIIVFMRVQGVGGFDIEAVYSYDYDRLYLPVADLFTFLKINNEVSANYLSIKGFLIDEKRTYEIDHTNRTITIDDKVIQLDDADILRTAMGLYLHTAVFGRVFGLYSTFHFRSMSVELKTDLELPAIREMRLQQMRRNLDRLRGVVEVDTIVGREFNLFRFGMLDWGFSSTQISRQTTDNRVSFGVGSEFLFGETNLFFNYSSRMGFDWRNQQYSWRWANNNSSIVRQVRAGKIGPGSISSIFHPMHGVSVTNASTQYRRSFGEYTFSDYTEPGWTVELYVNNVLVAYQVADASGYYTFDVPLVYGTSQVKFKFYGPHGEERIREQFLNIPFNFLPGGEVEYTITSGIVQDDDNSTFSRAVMHVGVNRFLTVGGGIEHLSSIETGTEIPFVNASLAPWRGLMISGEYAHGVKTSGLLSLRLPSNLMMEIDYINYEEGQKAIRFNYLEERRASLNIPIRTGFLRGIARLSFKQNVYDLMTYNTANATFSTHFGPVSANISGNAGWITDRKPFIYSNLTLGVRLPGGFVLRPQAQYDFTNNEFISAKADIERRIDRTGHVALGYQENFLADYRSVDVTFRWDLSFAQTNASVRVSNQNITTTQGIRGSLAFGSGNGYIHTDNRSSIGRGGLTIIPFVDINHNGVWDKGEPLATGLNVRVNGGRMLRTVNDTIIRIIQLEQYTSYLVELDDAGLDNIAWQLKDKVLSVHIDPNQFKRLEIPVLPMGEINGMVTLQTETDIRGIGRIVMNIYKSDSTYVTRVISESDGFVTYLGLPPGDYFAKISSSQMERVGMTASPASINFSIEPMAIGDIVDGLDFTLQISDDDITGEVDESAADTVSENVADADIPKVRVWELDVFSPLAGEYYLQAGAFADHQNILDAIDQIPENFPCPIGIVFEDDLYKIRFGHFLLQSEAEECIAMLDQSELPSVKMRGEYGNVFIHAATYNQITDALKNAATVAEIVSKPVTIVADDDVFSMRIGFFVPPDDVHGHLSKLIEAGYDAEIIVEEE